MRTAEALSDCAKAQSDQGLYYPWTESLDTADVWMKSKGTDDTLCIQDDLNLCILCMFEDTFLLNVA